MKLLQDGVKRTNILYGGKDIKGSRIVFVNGSIDPWHRLGITSSKNPQLPAVFIQGKRLGFVSNLNLTFCPTRNGSLCQYVPSVKEGFQGIETSQRISQQIHP